MSDYLSVPKPYLVILALYELGGEADLESISITAFELFPGIFAWKNHPEFPDKDVVRVSLSDAKKAQFGHLVSDKDMRAEGDRSKGRVKRYALTQQGLAKARELLPGLERGTLKAQPTSLQFKRVIEPLMKSSGFTRYCEGESLSEIGLQAFLQSFKLFPDATPFVITGRLARTEKIISSLPRGHDRERLEAYLTAGREAFQL